MPRAYLIKIPSAKWHLLKWQCFGFDPRNTGVYPQKKRDEYVHVAQLWHPCHRCFYGDKRRYYA